MLAKNPLTKNLNAMIEYAKNILPKVSIWKNLFNKELRKCVNWVEPEEWFELRNWCYDTFYEDHAEILDEIYQSKRVLQTTQSSVRKIVSPTLAAKSSIFERTRKVMP